jgi:pilus assembly protein CpaB
MRRKIVGIIVAVLLAAIGTIALVAYVQQAKDEAVQDEESVTALVVTSPLRQGATAAEISAAVEPTSIPARLVAPDALTDVDDIGDLVTAVELLEGEQLLASRLVSADDLVSVDVPAGLQEITIGLDPQRALGASLEAGDTVGILMSFEPFDVGTTGTDPTGADPADTGTAAQTPNTSHLALNGVLVTGVQLSQVDSDRVTENADTSDEDAPSVVVAEAPSDEVLITFAVTTAQAEQLVFAAEFGTIWLTAQNPSTDTSGAQIVTLADTYGAVQP